MKNFFIFLIALILILTILFLLVQLGPVLGTFLYFLKGLIFPFFIALIISYLLHPIVSALHDRGVPRSIAVLLIYVLFFGSITVIVMNAFPVLLSQIKDFAEHLPNMLNRFQGWMDGIRHDHTNPIPDSFQDGIDATLENLEKKIGQGFTNVLSWIGNTINIAVTIALVPFVAFYILKDYQLIEKTVMTFVPKKGRRNIIRLVKEIDEALGNYIRGQLLVCAVVGLLAYIGYLIIGLPYSLMLASIVSITNIIPYLGPFIGATPAILVALSVSWEMALSVLIVNLIVQVLEGNVISPQIVGKRLHIHPLFIIFSLLIGGELAGIVGLIFAVPVFAILKVIIQHVSLYYVKH